MSTKKKLQLIENMQHNLFFVKGWRNKNKIFEAQYILPSLWNAICLLLVEKCIDHLLLKAQEECILFFNAK
jgi:hypothetical protein